MESTGHIRGDLTTLPWVPVNVGGSKLLAKAWFGDIGYRLLLSDKSSIWEEEMSMNNIKSRAQVLNKRLRAPVDTFYAHLRSVAWPCFSRQYYEQNKAVHFLLKHQGGHLTVKLKSELGDVPFYWEFCCTPASVSLVFRELVCPLLCMTQVLCRHVEELKDLLLKKDAEIQDYKENGAMLSRGRLQTEPFEEETHRRNFNQRLPVMLQDCPEFDSEMQDLYMSIHTARNAQKRKHSGEYSSASVDSFIPDLDQISCMPTGYCILVSSAHVCFTMHSYCLSYFGAHFTGMMPASQSFNPECTRQQAKDTLSGNTKETVGLLPAADFAVPPEDTSTDRSVMHTKKKKAAGLFQ